MTNRKQILDAIGQQDEHLTKNPSTTHLKSIHQTHTNFSKNILHIYPTAFKSDNIPYDFGDNISFDIEKPSDLLLKVNLQIKVEGEGWGSSNIVPETMYALIEYIEILADTTVLQRLHGHWLYIWNQLKDPTEKQYIPQHAYVSKFNKTSVSPTQHTLNLDIPFWFESSPGLALPLWAIQHEKIYIRLKLRKFTEITLNNSNVNDYIIRDICLLTELVELDHNEKQKFQNTPLEYLIEQVEFNGNKYIEKDRASRQKIELLKYPFVNEILWFFSGTDFTGNIGPNNYFNFWKEYDGNPQTRIDHTNNVSILLNGNPINSRFKSSYYRKVQRYQSHSTGSVYNNNLESDNTNISYNSIYLYNFSFDPETIKPSGFLSTTKFNQIVLDLNVLSSNFNRYLQIFIKRFNIIRIQDGHINILNT